MRASAMISAAPDLGRTRRITLVKNSLTEYRTNAFDINWVDASIPQRNSANRTIEAIDLVDTAIYFVGFIVNGQQTSTPDPGQPKEQGQRRAGRWSPILRS
jgi:hypothetical protein